MKAFYDLIERQQIALLKGESESLTATIQDLANKWEWNRETVTRFLDNLEQLNALTVSSTGTRRTIRLNYSIDDNNDGGDSPSPSEPLKPSCPSNSTYPTFHCVTTPKNARQRNRNATGGKGGTPHFATASRSIGKTPRALARIAAMPQ